MLRRTNHSPYMRRVAWIKEIQKLLRQRRMEQATDVLRLLRKVRSAMNVRFCTRRLQVEETQLGELLMESLFVSCKHVIL